VLRAVHPHFLFPSSRSIVHASNSCCWKHSIVKASSRLASSRFQVGVSKADLWRAVATSLWKDGRFV
jgi:hypothetical protein